MPSALPFVAVVMATYRRSSDLRRVLAALQKTDIPLAVLVVDNADDPQTAAVVAEASLDVTRLVPGRNLGAGAGLAYGERAALDRFGTRLTHLWLADDDAEPTPGALEALLATIQRESAALAVPIITGGGNGQIAWFPGLLEKNPFAAIRKAKTPAEYLATTGPTPVPFSWATGVSILITREALERWGFHRDDFLIRGEDLEFTLRITAHERGVFVPEAHVIHHVGYTAPTPESQKDDRVKAAAWLQNVIYIATRLPHGRRILRTIPRNTLHFLRECGWRIGLPLAIRAYWKGLLLGRPAGWKRGGVEGREK